MRLFSQRLKMRNPTASDSSHRRPFQFTVRALLLLTLVVAVPCCYVAFVRMQFAEQLRAAERLEELGAHGNRIPRKGEFLCHFLGPDVYFEVTGIEINKRPVTMDMMACVGKLFALRQFCVQKSSFDGELLVNLVDLKKITSIWLKHVRTSDAAWKYVGRLNGVDDLLLPGSGIGDEGVRNLAGLKKLRRLDLGGTPVSDASLTVLAQLPNLENLCLAATNVTDAAVPQLCTMRSLKVLWLTNTRVTEAGVRELKKAFPDAEFRGPDMNRDWKGIYGN